MRTSRMRRFRGKRRFSARRRGRGKSMELNYHDIRCRVLNNSTQKSLADVTNDTTVAYGVKLTNAPQILLWNETRTTEDMTYAPITYIAQGTSSNNRIGKRILVKKVMLDLNISVTGTGTAKGDAPSLDNPVMPDNCEVHFALVRHKAAAGSYPVNRHLYENTSSSETPQRTSMFRQKNYVSQYEVLKNWTKRIRLDVETQGADGVNRVCEGLASVRKTISINKYVIYKNDLSTGIPEAHQDGGLYLMCWINLDSTAIQCLVQGMGRVTFIDV